MTVGERIKQRRIELGLTQTELAQRMGYTSKSAISKVEKDKSDNITTDRVQKFAKVLGVTSSYLMGWEDNDNKDNSYYTDTAAARLAQYYFQMEEYRILFDAAKDSKPEDIQMAADLLKRLKGTNPDG